MANPSYGTTYDEALPRLSEIDLNSPSASTRSGSYSELADEVSIEVGSSRAVSIQVRGWTQLYTSTLKIRIAYQIRYADTYGSAWGAWQSAAGVADAWTQLYASATGTNVTLNGLTGQYNYVTTQSNPSIVLNPQSGKTAMQMRVQAWYWDSGASTYGDAIESIFDISFVDVSGFSLSGTDHMARNVVNATLTHSSNAPAAGTVAVGYMSGSTFVKVPATVTFGGSSMGIEISGAGYAAYSSGGNRQLAVKLTDLALHNGARVTTESNWNTVQSANAIVATMSSDSRDTSITAPTISLSETRDGMLYVEIPDSSYEYVSIHAYWGDQSAHWYTGNVTAECQRSGSKWVASLLAASNKLLRITVYAYRTISGTLRYNSTSNLTATLHSDAFMLDSGDYHVRLRYESKDNQQHQTAATAVRMASGRTVARFGEGGSTRISLTGELLGSDHDVSSQWIYYADMLRQNVVWTYRNPLGDMMDVVITDVGRTPSGRWDVLTLSVTMERVG